LLLLRRPNAKEEPCLRWVCARKWPAILFCGSSDSTRKANNHMYCHMRLYDDDNEE
jgi:hypothetical protein